MSIDIIVSEVGPRDGLQNTKQFMPTEAKKAWITAMAAAGVPEIEVTSFVPPKLIPQFIDAADIVAHALTLPGLAVAALVPNLKGAERAIAAGARKIGFPLSVSRGHSLSNVRKTPDEQLEELRRIVTYRAVNSIKVEISAGMATAFGCTIDGNVPESEVVRLAVASAAAGADEVTLADTVGYADPAQIKRLVRLVRAEIGARLTCIHLHNTRGLGLANALAAIEEGIKTVDSSQAGLGGCPYAPGVSGNIVTEDLVFMLERMGLRTGIDLEKLLAARAILEAAVPGAEFHGNLARAGLPKGWKHAA